MTTEREDDRLEALLEEEAAGGGRLTLDRARRIASRTGRPLAAVEAAALAQGLVPERYDRNIGTVGTDGQRKLLQCCACVVGLGGLGGHVVESLARLGVGRIVGIDADRIAESNLNRQILAAVDTLGSAKTEQAALRVAGVNPAVQFSGHAAPFEQVPDDVLAGCCVVFDCLDSIPARRALAATCARVGVTLVHGAIAGWSGQVAVCGPRSALPDKLWPEGKRGLERRLGCPPFTAAVAAGLMVARAVPLLLGRAPAPAETILYFDLLDEEWQTVEP